MTMKTMLMVAAAAVAFTAVAASAQPYGNGQNMGPRRGDPDGYYSRVDQNGYYDRQGRYRDMRQGDNFRDDRQPQGGTYYQQGAYEQNCRQGNVAAGTIFGAIAGGLIGSAASRGNGGAVVGGAVLGGLLGNTISKDIDCDAQPVAYRTYSTGLNGPIGRRNDWSYGQQRGYFTPTRDFRRGQQDCREFTAVTYRNGQQYTRSGVSCRAQDGNWRFD